jgi:hypothetical protein
VDYGFDPTRDDYNALVRQMFALRPGTTLLNPKDLVTLKGLMAKLVALPLGSKPIGDVLLGGHANSSGDMYLNMFPDQRRKVNGKYKDDPTTFEVLERALLDPAHPLELPDALIGFTPGDVVTHAVRFKGCNLGKDRSDTTRLPINPFLDRLKQVLGGHVVVTAPKHFHYMYPAISLGLFESMIYEFVVRTPAVKVKGGFRGFATKAELVQACVDAGFTDVNGVAFPEATWNVVIPRSITKPWKGDPPVSLGVAIGRRKTAPARRELRIENRPITFAIPFADPAMSPLPTTDADRFQILEALIGSEPTWDVAYDYPMYERSGYPDLPSFMDGHHWSYGSNRSHMLCTGRRYAYTVMFPITDVNGDLHFNFYPNSGSPHASILTGLQETDATFFASV